MSLTVAVDFDGVLADKNMDPIEGAHAMVTRLWKADVHLFVHSSRASWGGGKAQIESWLAYHEFPPMPVVPKVKADVYLDDRAIRFDDWATAYPAIVREKGRNE